MEFDKTGGFRWLDSWVMGSVIQLATFRFCERFLTRQLDPTGRQYDQMTQEEETTLRKVTNECRAGTPVV